MTTIVNTPAQAPQNEGNGIGFLLGLILIVGFFSLAFYFGIPVIRNLKTIQVNVPATEVNVDAPQVVMPDKVDVKVEPAE